MVFHGLGPLGCIPSQRVKSKRGQCLKQVNEWIQQFNSKVQKLIIKLNRGLPNAKLVFADTYPLVLDLIDNPSTYGKISILSLTLCSRLFNYIQQQCTHFSIAVFLQVLKFQIHLVVM